MGRKASGLNHSSIWKVAGLPMASVQPMSLPFNDIAFAHVCYSLGPDFWWRNINYTEITKHG
ncbi:hypothetical protein [Vibrio parahaemolyticus RIMD 2210633]|uniref:Uncharacterized protein n=1 Tax=Vibrio parahaemolyticus serotype O3:K6 (strain RIMD 2210633) TaxID=223926 RepID=Q87QX0_VIBPA|nr:hypothetical protein [Vibrio parahaemolyticus RIMD 2210633]